MTPTQHAAIVNAINKLLAVNTGNDFEVECMQAASALQLEFDIPGDEVDLIREHTV